MCIILLMNVGGVPKIKLTFVFLLKFPYLTIFLLNTQNKSRPWSMPCHLVKGLNLLLILKNTKKGIKFETAVWYAWPVWYHPYKLINAITIYGIGLLIRTILTQRTVNTISKSLNSLIAYLALEKLNYWIDSRSWLDDLNVFVKHYITSWILLYECHGNSQERFGHIILS